MGRLAILAVLALGACGEPSDDGRPGDPETDGDPALDETGPTAETDETAAGGTAGDTGDTLATGDSGGSGGPPAIPCPRPQAGQGARELFVSLDDLQDYWGRPRDEVNRTVEPYVVLSTLDFDDDGDDDLLAQLFLGDVGLYENVGGCDFVFRRDFGPAVQARAADVDGDGHEDVVLGVASDDPLVHAEIVADVMWPLLEAASREVGVVDPPDLPVYLRVHRGDGAGGFLPPSDLGFTGPINTGPTGSPWALGYDYPRAFSTYDLDGDGVLELIVQNYMISPIKVLRYEAGVMTERTDLAPWCDADATFAPVDLDRDGAKEFFCTHFGDLGPAGGLDIYGRDPGTGGFVLEETHFSGYDTMGSVYADWTGDGWLDVAHSDQSHLLVGVNDGTGRLFDVSGAWGIGDERPLDQRYGFPTFWDVLALDHDLDGDLDLVGTASMMWPRQPHPQQIVFYDNQGGTGLVSIEDDLGIGRMLHERAVVSRDLDGDCVPELVIGSGILAPEHDVGGTPVRGDLRLIVFDTPPDACVRVDVHRAGTGLPAFGETLTMHYGPARQVALHLHSGTSLGGQHDSVVSVSNVYVEPDGTRRPLTHVTVGDHRVDYTAGRRRLAVAVP